MIKNIVTSYKFNIVTSCKFNIVTSYKLGRPNIFVMQKIIISFAKNIFLRNKNV